MSNSEKSRRPRQQNRNHKLGWLAGFIDGEGCVYFRHNIQRDGQWRSLRVITVSNTDKGLIKHAALILADLKIDHSIYARPAATANRKPFWTLEIRRGESMQRFLNIVPIQSMPKFKRLIESLKFFRGVRCKGCGIKLQFRRRGCYQCRKRHELRKRVAA